MKRDDKIAILENHINHMEDEIRRLQDNLAQVIDTGENIKDNSYVKMDQSMKTLEAHRKFKMNKTLFHFVSLNINIYKLFYVFRFESCT